MSSQISRNFLRELYSPENAEIDIVAVHGLNPKGSDEHAEETWTASNGKMWLKDFLPLKLGTARILLCGYNSNVAFQTSINGVRDHAMNLLNRLVLERKDCMERPIIFVCHSLGGLVVKRALVIAQANKTFASVKYATHGIVFFGTPHRGGNAASLGKTISSIVRFCLRNPSNSLMESLKDSNLANELVEDFRAQLESYFFISFYETQLYHKLGLIVDRRSATLGLQIDRETQVGLEANHSTICKFGASDDDAYKQVESNIMVLTEKVLLAAKGWAHQSRTNALVTNRETLPPDPKLPFSVPFIRNRNFTGRDLILAKLSRGLELKEGYQPRAVLYGLGGIGKSQIAVEFAYRVKGRAIYWMNGETDESFARDYMEVAETIGLALADANEEAVCNGVKAWFESEGSGDWLLIVDNFDDIDLRFIRWLPLRNGAIIFTSRDKRAVEVLSAGAAIEVNSMTDSEAFDTFARLTAGEGNNLDGSNIDKLLQLLDNSPLAIAHATAFIQQTWISVDDYISMFERDHSLLAETSPGMPRSVIGTLAITIEKIQQEQPLAAKLLELMSLLDYQSIPKTLLRGLSWPELREDIAFVKTIRVLSNYSLVNQTSQHGYRLHTLVGLSARVRMQPATYSTRLTDAVNLIHTEFPEGTFENVAQCSLLLPHAISVVTKAEPLSMVSRVIYDLECRIAGHLYERGVYTGASDHVHKGFKLAETLGLTDHDLLRNWSLLGRILTRRGCYTEGLEWHQKTLAGQEKVLGSDHPGTLGTVNDIAKVFYSQGKYGDALEWHRRALSGQEKALGSDHPDTLRTISNIANVFYRQGKYEGALGWHRRALSGQEKVLGSDHPDTLKTVSNIAIVFYNQGKYEDALEWHRQVLTGREKALGSDHPDTLRTINSIAIVFYGQGKYEDALGWYRRALSGQEKALGSDHPDTLRTISNIANVSCSQGEYDDALGWYRRTLSGQEKALGSDHPDTLRTINNIANVFCSQGRYEDALGWYRRALPEQEKALGSDHPDTLWTINSIAIVFYSQGKCEDALGWYRRALAGREKALGSDHPDMLKTISNIAIVFCSQGKYEDALGWFRRALPGQEKALGSDHPDTLWTISSIANVFRSQGKYEDALEWHRRALAGWEKALGSDHPDTLRTINNIAIVFSSQIKYEDALEWYRRALTGQEKALGSDHPDTLRTISNIAGVFCDQGKCEDALEWYRRALFGQEKALGSDHPDTLKVIGNIAGVFYRQGKYEDALEWYRRALAGREKALGSDHPDTLWTISSIANVFCSQGKYEDALEWYRRALTGQEKALGSDHPDTLWTISSIANVFRSQGKYEDALEWYRRALTGQEKALGSDHPDTLRTISSIANVFRSQGKYEDALEWYRRALTGQEKALGSDHPDTLRTISKIRGLRRAPWYARAREVIVRRVPGAVAKK